MNSCPELHLTADQVKVSLATEEFPQLDSSDRKSNGAVCAPAPKQVDREQCSSRPVPTDFEALSDGTLLELIQHPSDPQRTSFAVWKDGQVSCTEKVERNGQIFVPINHNHGIWKFIRLAQTVIPYESPSSLAIELSQLITRCVVVEDSYLTPLICFVFCTWFADRLQIAPYLSIVGLPQSGKTTLLALLNLVCRRPLLTADINLPGLNHEYQCIVPTLLLDEADTHADERNLRRLLRVGSTRDVLAKAHHGLCLFGPKVVSWGLGPPEDIALSSRCIQIQMNEVPNVNLEKLTDPSIEQAATELQAKLLCFRLNTYHNFRLAEISNHPILRPRSRDLLTCLSAPFRDDLEICEDLLRFFVDREIFTREPLDSHVNAVLATLFRRIHERPDQGLVLIRDFAWDVNDHLKNSGEHFRLKPRRIGAILTTLGIRSRRRTNVGWLLCLNKTEQERIHRIVASYGVDRRQPMEVNPSQCALCQQH